MCAWVPTSTQPCPQATQNRHEPPPYPTPLPRCLAVQTHSRTGECLLQFNQKRCRVVVLPPTLLAASPAAALSPPVLRTPGAQGAGGRAEVAAPIATPVNARARGRHVAVANRVKHRNRLQQSQMKGKKEEKKGYRDRW